MMPITINALLINLILILLSGIFILHNTALKNRKKIYVVVVTIQWIILSGLRHVSIGNDTINYMHLYNRELYRSWGEIFQNINNIRVFGSQGIDAGYYIFQKITQLMSVNYQFYLFLIAFIFTTCLGVWVYKYSKDAMISFLLYSVLFYSFFSFTGIRQTIATALIVLVGYKYIKEKNLIHFILVTLISVTIHKSAIVFFPFYFLANKKVTRKYLITILTLFAIIMYFRIPIALFFQKLSGYEYGIYDGAGTINFTLMLLLIFLVALWRIKLIISVNYYSNHYINALGLALLFTPLTWVNPSAMRVVQYFSIFLMLLIPDIIKTFKKEERPLAYFVIISLLLLLFIRNIPEYLFYWQ